MSVAALATRLVFWQTLPFLVVGGVAPLFVRGDTLESVVFFACLVLPIAGSFAFCAAHRPSGHRWIIPFVLALAGFGAIFAAFELVFLWMELGPRYLFEPDRYDVSFWTQL